MKTIPPKSMTDLLKLSTCVVVFIGMTACSTSNNDGSPITYKIAKGEITQYAANGPIELPEAMKRPYAEPRATIPAPHSPISQAPLAEPQNLNRFDTASVDHKLHSHQIVGNPYTVFGKTYSPEHNPRYDEIGTASWYGHKFHGKPTASGEIYNKNDLTAAHKTLPMNSLVHVTNIENGKTLTVRINDRGPFIGERIIDLSEVSAMALGITGLSQVRVQYAGASDARSVRHMYESPKAQKPRPVPQNRDRIAEAPRAVKPAQPPQSEYRPLREIYEVKPEPQAQKQAQKQAEARPEAPIAPPVATPPVVSAPPATQPQAIAPFVQPVPLPSHPEARAPSPPKGDGLMTLTIKGPIHMAKMDENSPKARFIPAVNKTTYTTHP